MVTATIVVTMTITAGSENKSGTLDTISNPMKMKKLILQTWYHIPVFAECFLV
jgi:hypothetical protein